MHFHICDRPTLFPQADVIGDVSEAAGPYVDLNIELERATHLYLGARVVREILRVAQPDLIPAKELSDALAREKTALTYVANTEAENTKLRAAAAQYQRTEDALETLQAAHASLQTEYAKLEAGGARTAQQRLSEATKPARKPVAAGKK